MYSCNIFADEIKAMKEEGLDPLTESHNVDHSSVQTTRSTTVNNVESLQMKGLLLFIHGTPCDGNTNYITSNITIIKLEGKIFVEICVLLFF